MDVFLHMIFVLVSLQLRLLDAKEEDFQDYLNVEKRFCTHPNCNTPNICLGATCFYMPSGASVNPSSRGIGLLQKLRKVLKRYKGIAETQRHTNDDGPDRAMSLHNKRRLRCYHHVFHHSFAMD